MAALCKFCDREFDNPQGVRAHLKGCEAYKGRGRVLVAAGDDRGELVVAPRRGAVPKKRVQKSFAVGYSRVDQIENEVAASEARLRLRQVEAAHREAEQEEQRARDRELAGQRARRAEERAGRVQAESRQIEAAVRAERRVVIQGIKAEVMRRSVPYHVTASLQAEAIRAIEKDLGVLPVDELPRTELVQIAEAARDRAYQPAIEEQRKSREREERSAHESLERMGKMRKAFEYARSHLEREVSSGGLEDEVDYFERSKIMKRIEDDLEMEFDDRNPSAAELREAVEDMVSEELDGWADEDEDEVEEDE
jgi:hypothetical protein